MAVTTPQDVHPKTAAAGADLQETARRHLWMHFSRMGGYDAEHEIPIIARGEGAYVWDDHGNRYLDGLSALFCCNAGHGRADYGEAAAAQIRELDFYTNWSYAHPRAIELAERIAELAPGDLNRVFFTNSGSEAVESAIKVARNWYRAHGKGQKHKIVTREVAYHGTTMGALTATGLTDLKVPFEPTCRAATTSANTNEYHWPDDRDPLWAAEQIRQRIEFEGPDTVAAVILEPLQNAGGCIPPQEGYFQRVREICDEHDVLLVSDEVICSWGRLGHYFGCERYGYQPDIITTAKALTGAYIPMGAMIVSDEVFEPFATGSRVVRPRLDLRRPSGRRGGRPAQPRRLRRGGPLRPRPRARRTSSAASSRTCGTSRSSATSAAPASSTRSSWSRTARRRRPSAATRASGCCAASSPASSTGAA